MTTFGYELEFASGPGEVIAALSARGYAEQLEPRLHPYHCDCVNCMSLGTIRFRAQRDSSCGGEIISGVFNDGDWDYAVDSMQALQEAALDCDAAIDTNCGMHVHIGNSDGDVIADAATLAMAWLGVEPLMWEHVAGAAWAMRRGDQNHLLSQTMVDMMGSMRLWDRHGVYPCREQDLGSMSEDLQRDYVRDFHRVLATMGWDRHCDLARANHGGMYEIRVFNATRVAWRIELACRLSVALVDPEVAGHFAEMTERFLFGQEAQLPNRMHSLRNAYRRPGRQYASRPERPLQAVLPISMEEFTTTLVDFDERLGDLLTKQTGYAAARKEVGALRGVISNSIDMSMWNHSAVLAALTPQEETVDA